MRGERRHYIILHIYTRMRSLVLETNYYFFFFPSFCSCTHGGFGDGRDESAAGVHDDVCFGTVRSRRLLTQGNLEKNPKIRTVRGLARGQHLHYPRDLREKLAADETAVVESNRR